MLKLCNTCKNEKKLDEFYKSKKGKFGVEGSCKECVLKKKKKYNKGGKPGIKKGTIVGPKMIIHDYLTELSKIHNNKYMYNLVKKHYMRDKIDIICPIHGLFRQKSIDHKRGHGCPKCANSIVANRSNRDEIIKRANNVHDNFYDYSFVEYVNDYTKIKINCPIHGIFEQTPGSHIRNKSGCPSCSMSKGEREISIILNKMDINFIPQMKFEDCKYYRPLPFDFFLPYYNTIIEYDGIHHFQPTDFSNGSQDEDKILKSFKLTKLKDKIKDNFCKIKNIRMIRISYRDEISIQILKDLL